MQIRVPVSSVVRPCSDVAAELYWLLSRITTQETTTWISCTRVYPCQYTCHRVSSPLDWTYL